ncbi:transposase [Alisedimentitalea sp. MJ-SS2]|uniref:REP-associated tyrosine transposase n=1 Tax=Aliisedimentitalea sp. MJ-SS2 TaxID=3049795 RepID=UPI00290C5F97|nr:transposase [Alisedimentitalea sp. MJ-SS2]MDU8927476.1 transposase [Alisedimentitalea sp. MJ-SS2]
MSCYIRPHVPGASVFYTVNLAARGSDLLIREIGALRRAVRKTRAERPFDIGAWVVMPDHLHAVWTMPEGDADFSVRWGAIKARFTRSLRDRCRVGFHPTHAKRMGQAVGWNPTLRRSASKVAKGDAGIWQRRFWEHHIRGPQEFADCVRYCHFNPVKHGFVERPEDWLYSSVHRERQLGSWEAA